MLQLEKFTCISEVWCINFRASRVPHPHTQKLKKELADTVDLPLQVTKCGRTTTRAAGRVNEIDALKYGKWGEGRALSIIGAGVHGPFSMKGDLGSIVFTDEVRPVVLIIGGRRSGFRDISTATPIDVIMREIVSRTG